MNVRRVAKHERVNVCLFALWMWQRTDKPSTRLKRWKAWMQLFD